MTNWTRVLGGGAVGVGVAVAGYVLWSLDRLEPGTGDQSAALATSEPANRAQAPKTEPPATPAPVAQEDPAPPSFDLVRIEADGSALVAGQGLPDARMTVFLDGDEIATLTSGSDGKFASLVDISPSPQPRMMTLAMQVGDRAVPAETEIIVAPFGSHGEKPVSEPEVAEAKSPVGQEESSGTAGEQVAGRDLQEPAGTGAQGQSGEAEAAETFAFKTEKRLTEDAPVLNLVSPEETGSDAAGADVTPPSTDAAEDVREDGTQTGTPDLAETDKAAVPVLAEEDTPVIASDDPARTEAAASADSTVKPEADLRTDGAPEEARALATDVPTPAETLEGANDQARDVASSPEESVEDTPPQAEDGTGTEAPTEVLGDADAQATAAVQPDAATEEASAAPDDAESAATAASQSEPEAIPSDVEVKTGDEAETAQAPRRAVNEAQAALPAEPETAPAKDTAASSDETAATDAVDHAADTPGFQPAEETQADESRAAPEVAEADAAGDGAEAAVTPADGSGTDPVQTDIDTPDAPSAPRLLASDENGVRVLPGPEVLDRVAIDTISYDDAGEVALAGRGAGTEGGGFVRVYLDNTPITTSRIQPDGSWRVDLPEVDKGVYVLRVDEVDAAGAVRSRAETPFLREDRAALERAGEEAEGGPVKVVTVQPGNTLWQIARDRYGEGLLYVRVFDANRSQIRDPDLIYPGQVFDLPTEVASPDR